MFYAAIPCKQITEIYLYKTSVLESKTINTAINKTIIQLSNFSNMAFSMYLVMYVVIVWISRILATGY